MGSGKKVIAAGPGNPPAVVDETADLDIAAAGHRPRRVDRQQHHLHGGEGSRRGRFDRRRRCRSASGARGRWSLNERQVKRAREGRAPPGDGRRPPEQELRRQERRPHRAPDRRDGRRRAAPARCRGRREAPVRAARDADAGAAARARRPTPPTAIAVAKRVEHGFGHTAVMYSRNIAHLHAMARTINTSIFVKNASQPGGPGARRRGLHLVHHRLADGRGADHGPQLHARAPLHAQGILPDRMIEAGPALALIELSSIARGHRVADAMVKRAPVNLLRADWVSPGKFLVLVDGSVAAVDEAYRAGLDVAADKVVDRLFSRRRTPRWVWRCAGDVPDPAIVDSLGIVGDDHRRRDAARRRRRGQSGRRASHRDAARPRDRRQGVLHRHRLPGRGRGGGRGGGGDPGGASAVFATEIIAAPHADLTRKMRAKEAPPHSR